MKKVLFGYRTGSVFGYYPDKEKSVEVYEEDGKFFFEFTPKRGDKELKHYKAEILNYAINRIKRVYAENAELFYVEDVEWPPVLDGSNHRFSFADDEHDVEINASNIWYYANDYEGERAVNAEIVLMVYSEVAEILVEAGVDKEMLML